MTFLPEHLPKYESDQANIKYEGNVKDSGWHCYCGVDCDGPPKEKESFVNDGTMWTTVSRSNQLDE